MKYIDVNTLLSKTGGESSPFKLGSDRLDVQRAQATKGAQASRSDGVLAVPGVEEARPQDHDGLARALLQLHLDGAELAVDDVHHALDLLGRDGPRPALLPQQVHHVRGELAAGLKIHTLVSTNHKTPASCFPPSEYIAKNTL